MTKFVFKEFYTHFWGDLIDKSNACVRNRTFKCPETQTPSTDADGITSTKRKHFFFRKHHFFVAGGDIQTDVQRDVETGGWDHMSHTNKSPVIF